MTRVQIFFFIFFGSVLNDGTSYFIKLYLKMTVICISIRSNHRQIDKSIYNKIIRSVIHNIVHRYKMCVDKYLARNHAADQIE